METMIQPKLPNCAFCQCKLSIGEKFLCTDCLTDGRNLLRKVEQLKEWRKTLDEKLEVVEKLVDDIENIVADMQE
jgi:hypothetical protein|tara:strand:+ start:294 stop:518 length:225 start_codon:yes stop_codon:yes gene_type:complete